MHRLSTEIYQFLQASSPTLILEPNQPFFSIIYANSAYYRVTGTTAEDLIGVGFLDAFPENPDSPETGNVEVLRSKLVECVMSKQETLLPVQRYDIPIRGTNEYDIRYWQAANNPVLNSSGQIEYIIHTTVDITGAFELAKKERIAKEVAEKSHESLLNLIMQSPVAICIFKGPEYILDIANPKMFEFLGIGGEFLNKPIFRGLPYLENDFKPLLDEVYYYGNMVQVDEKPVDLLRDGKLAPRYINFSYQPLKELDGTTSGVIAIAVDITTQVIGRRVLETSQKATQELNEELTSINEELAATNEELISARLKTGQAEAQLRLAIEGANLGSWYIHQETNEFEYNSKLAEMYGYEGKEPMRLEDGMSRIVDEDREWVTKEIEKAVERGNDYDVIFAMRKFNDDSIIWVRALGKIAKASTGENAVFAGIAMDVTEQKKDEQRKNDFIAMVSHELKTPLTSMRAYVQMLLNKARKTDDGFTIRTLEQADKQIRKMTTIVNGFLNVSRLEAGKIHIEKRLFDMADLMKEVEEEVASTISTHKVIFRPVIYTPVRADRDKIGQVVNNLISNAVKYSPAEGNIQVACVTIGDFALVSVQDEGRGIHPDDKEKLFDRYYRVQDSPANPISGFGIGLYLSAEIIKRHQGKIWVESEPRKGSTFYFSLPCELEEKDEKNR